MANPIKKLLSQAEPEDTIVDAAIKTKHEAHAVQGALFQKGEKLRKELKAAISEREQASYRSETGAGDDKTYLAAEAKVAAIELAIRKVEEATTVAQAKVIEAEKVLHDAGQAKFVAIAKRKINRRVKASTAVADALAKYADAFRDLLAANDDLVISNPFGIAPQGCGMFPRELVDMIERELARLHPVDDLSVHHTPRLPGALANATAGNPAAFKSFTEVMEQHNDFILKRIEKGPGK